MYCKQKLWILLTICRKAGKMQMGLEPAKDALLHQTAAGLLLAADASENTKKEAAFFSAKAGVPLLELPFTKFEMGQAVGRASAVFAVCDAGFFRRMQALTRENSGENA